MALFGVLFWGEMQPQATGASPPMPLYGNREQPWWSTNFSALSVRGKQGRGRGKVGEIWALQ